MPLRFIDITPDRSLFAKLGQGGYSTSEALAELVDNAIDAQASRVGLSLSKSKIKVTDDGGGMDETDAALSLRLGHSTKKNQLGQFGLGLKTAALSLGRDFEVVSANGHEEFTLKFQEKEWLNHGNWSRFPIRVKKTKHKGTDIQIQRLHVRMDAHAIRWIREDLQARFGPFLAAGQIRITVNRSDCRSTPPALTQEGKKNVELQTPFGKITGWYGHKLASSVRDYFGFSTFRNRRLITAYDKIGLSLNPKAKQIVGEIHLDFVPVTHHKRAWVKESQPYRTAQAALEGFFRHLDAPLVRLVTGLSASPGRVEGKARVLDMGTLSTEDALEKVQKGDILVTQMTRPDMLLAIRRAAAVVTDMGGRTCHAAIVAREFGIPCIVGTQKATACIFDGKKVVVDATEGIVYASP